MPLIARWPGKISGGSTSDEICGLVDMLATLTAAAGGQLPAGPGVDSHNMLPAMLGEQLDQPIRDSILLQSLGPNDLAVRVGKWKLIPWLGSGGFLTKPARVEPSADEPKEAEDCQ